jgi:hypothetical protein
MTDRNTTPTPAKTTSKVTPLTIQREYTGAGTKG